MEYVKLYVGNLNYAVSTEELEHLFSDFGEVKGVNIVERRGFGFVEMADEHMAQRAKETLNGQEFRGRKLRVDYAGAPSRGRRRRRF